MGTLKIFVYIYLNTNSSLREILYAPWNEGNTVKENGERKGKNSVNKDRCPSATFCYVLRVFHQNNKYYLATQ